MKKPDPTYRYEMFHPKKACAQCGGHVFRVYLNRTLCKNCKHDDHKPAQK